MSEEKKGQPNLLLIDGNSLANRAFYAMPPLSTSRGVPTGAIHGFLTMLFRFLHEKRPTHIAVAFDHPSPTFRHGQFKEYKATRKPSPPDFKAQLPELMEVLDTLKIPAIELAGYEADDIIGTLCARGLAGGFEVTVLSGDKDCLQLVSPKSRAILPIRGITLVKEYEPATVLEDMGFYPAQVTDFKALAGDASDNIPGVKGIGQKTAITLLSKFGNLEAIFDRIDEVAPPKVKALLEASKDVAFLSKDLATIKRDAPLSEELDELEWKGPDPERAKAKFTELEFGALTQRLGTFGDWAKERETEAQMLLLPDHPPDVRPASFEPELPPFEIVSEVEGLSRVVAAVQESGHMSLYSDAVNITRDFLWPRLVGVSTGPVDGGSASADKSSRDLSRIFLLKAPDGNPEAWQELLWKYLSPVLVDSRITKIGFDLKWLFALCFKRGIALRGFDFDVLIASYLLDPSRSTYRLPEIARRYSLLEVPFLPAKAEKGRDSQLPGTVEAHYAFGAASCFPVADGLLRDLEQERLVPLANDVEFPLIEVLAAMEATGVGVDLVLARSIGEQFGRALSDLEARIYAVAGESFNLGSPKQLAHILFEKLGLKPVKKTKTAFSTDAEVLEALSLEHELPEKILEYRQYAKLKSTYLDGLEGAVNPTTGRVHSTFHQTVTATGRLSSSEPNLQNIPVRGELGRSLRRIFVPPHGRLLLAADYSQIELRIMAHMADDPTMIDAFLKGEDIHKRTASEMFGVPLDEVSSDLRAKAKAVNFGVIYGISEFGLARNTKVTREEARHFIDAYFARYPMVKRFMELSVESARRSGYAVTILGRKRAIPEMDSRIRQKRGFAERTAINTPIQGSAADIIKLAMIKIYRRLREEGFISRMILQVHDELIFEIPASEESAMRELVTSEMEGVMALKVPLKVDLEVGESWYDV